MSLDWISLLKSVWFPAIDDVEALGRTNLDEQGYERVFMTFEGRWLKRFSAVKIGLIVSTSCSKT